MGRNPLKKDWDKYEDWCLWKQKKPTEQGFLMWIHKQQDEKRIDVI